jgi:exopolysaccharide production protein ExoZ
LKKLYSVQYLRAIAAILVVYSHAIDLQDRFGSSLQQKFYFLENFGAIGVDIFFVISGFIISVIAERNTGKAAATQFFKRRILRVVPVYYVASFIFFCLFNLFIKVSGPAIVKTLTVLPVFDSGPVFQNPILYIGWTLSFEFLFYILYGILIFYGVKKKENSLLIIAATLFIAGKIFPLHIVQWQFLTSPMILEFAMGVMIAKAYKSKETLQRYIPYLCLLCGIGLYVYLILTGCGNASEAEIVLESNAVATTRVVLWGIPSALLVAGFILREKNKTVSKPRSPLIFLGDASYSIYLAHPICFQALGSVVRRFPVLQKMPGDVLVFAFLVVGVLAGVIFYLWVEKPLLKRLKLLQA